jgi:uncharacterized membrane protein
MKKILISIGVLVTMSFTLNKATNYELYEAISDVEDYIEWLEEDYFQGNISQEEYEVMLENYNQTLQHLRNVERDILHLTQK